LAKLFNADAVTYNLFTHEFYPLGTGTGEPLVVRTHKALRPTCLPAKQQPTCTCASCG
jgi:hypothetical protein